MKIKLNNNEIIQIDKPEDILTNEVSYNLIKESDLYRYEHLHCNGNKDNKEFDTRVCIFDSEQLKVMSSYGRYAYVFGGTQNLVRRVSD